MRANGLLTQDYDRHLGPVNSITLIEGQSSTPLTIPHHHRQLLSLAPHLTHHLVTIASIITTTPAPTLTHAATPLVRWTPIREHVR